LQSQFQCQNKQTLFTTKNLQQLLKVFLYVYHKAMGKLFLPCKKSTLLKKIIVSVTNDLATDQRVAKICDSLQALDYEIVLVGRKLHNSPPLYRSYRTIRMQLIFNNGFLFYAEYAIRLFLLLLFSKKDILLANDLDTLLPNYLISVLQRKKIVYDSHELFTEIPELIDRPFTRKTWGRLEQWIVPKLQNTYTVCQSIATTYNQAYNTSFKVVRNLPVQKKTNPGSLGIDSAGKKIILYQGAINMGRGLEYFIDCMQYLDDFIFVLVGSGDILSQLQTRVAEGGLEQKVFFLGKKLPEALFKITPLADIGISAEEDLGLNYRFALPNKIFDYIQAEVPILVSNLPEMKQIVLQHKVGELIKETQPKKLAAQIQEMVHVDFSEALNSAKKTLTWEGEKEQLALVFNNLR